MSDGSPPIAGHGGAELRDAEGFLGDRASYRAFRALLESWRQRLREIDDEDPLGEEASEKISKKKLDKALASGDPEAAGVVQGAIEDFAGALSGVIKRLLRLKAWREVERIAIGGGLRDSRVGELAIGRTAVLLKADGYAVDLKPIRHDPDEAGLIGAAHLAPAWLFAGHDSILAVDIGGANIRAGVVALKLDRARDLSKAEVLKLELWRHRDDKPKRDEAVKRLIGMLEGLARWSAGEKRKLAPFIGVGCPGLIAADGGVERGDQNLPGDWSAGRFNLPAALSEAMPEIRGHRAAVVLHNDAVVQGLSEVPYMADVRRWGVLTVGTGLGNACFINRGANKD
jgi:predicted NBD/HSP70 family sugar kinase